MAYDPTTDFIGLWRNSGGAVSKLEMPGLDYLIIAFARAGLLEVAVSGTAPTVNQATTAWLQSAAPDWSAEGVLRLWDPVALAYAPATPTLFLYLLQASAGQNGVSWRTFIGVSPSNALGLNGDFAIRLDAPYGIYGPKIAGAWPITPIPGTADVLSSATMDNTFGGVPGSLLYRDNSVWKAFLIGSSYELMTVSTAGLPAWYGLPFLMDAVFGNTQGSVLIRNAGSWFSLAPGTVGQLLASGGVGANPFWVERTAEFPSGTSMLFRQTSAPPGWAKQTAINDVGLRVVSGVAGSGGSTPFSTAFSQTQVGDTTLSTGQMPSHHHVVNTYRNSASPLGIGTGGIAQQIAQVDSNSTDVGGGLPHNHGVNLTLAYVDVIIATKD